MTGSAVIIAVILFILYIFITKEALKSNIDSQNKRILYKLEQIIAMPLATHDFVMIVDLIDAETKTSYLDYIWISDTDGNIIACNDEAQIMLPIAEHFKNDSSFLSYRTKNGEIISILPSYSLVNSIIYKILVSTAIVLFLLITVIILLGFNFAKKITIPIKTIVNASKDMAEGNFEIFLPESSLTEVDEMTKSLKETSLKLKKDQETIWQNEKKYRNLFDNSTEALMIADSEGRFIDGNQAALKIFDLESIEQFISLSPAELSPQYQPDGLLSSKKAAKMIGQAIENGTNYFEWTHKKYSGDEFCATVLLSKIVLNDAVVVQATVRDITEQKRVDEVIKQSQKMETIGTLAGGLAHDFNNVLGGIMGTLSILKFKRKKKGGISEEQLDSYFETIEYSGKRAVDMVSQLLTLSRKKEMSMAPVDLNMTIKHVVKICENSFDKSINIIPTYLESPAMVNADPTQIEQVLLNFCVNASHAMIIMKPDNSSWGGELLLTLEDIYTDKHFIKANPLSENRRYWCLSVKDTGIGMKKELIEKIFDPFFTTKDKGEGTGLGLSMAYAIVKQHQGFLNVYSEVGIGSTFNMYIPSITDYVESINQGYQENLIPKGEGLILVVDDEKVMRNMAVDILVECGYRVILAENGKQALTIYKKSLKQIKLVLLDMVMPEMSGKETFIELKKINPDIKVILASGFRQDDRVNDVLKLGIRAFLQKPYTMKKLAETIANVIK